MSTDECDWGIEEEEPSKTDQQAIRRAEAIADNRMLETEQRMRKDGFHLVANIGGHLQVWKRGAQRTMVLGGIAEELR